MLVRGLELFTPCPLPCLDNLSDPNLHLCHLHCLSSGVVCSDVFVASTDISTTSADDSDIKGQRSGAKDAEAGKEAEREEQAARDNWDKSSGSGGNNGNGNGNGSSNGNGNNGNGNDNVGKRQ